MIRHGKSGAMIRVAGNRSLSCTVIQCGLKYGDEISHLSLSNDLCSVMKDMGNEYWARNLSKFSLTPLFIKSLNNLIVT